VVVVHDVRGDVSAYVHFGISVEAAATLAGMTTAAPVRTVEARLHTRSTQPPLLLGAALTPATAEWLGGWADGLVTVATPKGDHAKVAGTFQRGERK
jgi:alkanesulfonate monooxygenase SsuD/methylene tetrahydromethanopterin reductase-like flavin-dependent oxidoreductase (luciferase family)